MSNYTNQTQKEKLTLTIPLGTTNSGSTKLVVDGQWFFLLGNTKVKELNNLVSIGVDQDYWVLENQLNYGSSKSPLIGQSLDSLGT